MLRATHIETALRERRGRPVFLIDPPCRAAEPAINGVDGAYLYDIDDLSGWWPRTATRAPEARRAER